MIAMRRCKVSRPLEHDTVKNVMGERVADSVLHNDNDVPVGSSVRLRARQDRCIYSIFLLLREIDGI